MKIKSGFAKINETRLYYEIIGNGPPLVLIHGGLVDSRMWDNVFSILAENFMVIRYDLRGYGKSEDPKEKFSHIEDLFHLIKYFNIKQSYILGLSLGGMIASDFALEHPDMVDALILVSSALNGFGYDDDARELSNIIKIAAVEGLDNGAELLMETSSFKPAVNDPTIRQKMNMMIRDNFNRWANFSYLNIWPSPPTIQRLPDIKTQTLVVVGDQDGKSILDTADTFINKIPMVQKQIINGASHHANMDKPDDFKRIVSDFLNNF